MTNNAAQIVSRTSSSVTVNVYSNHNTGPELEDAPFSIMIAGQAADVSSDAVRFANAADEATNWLLGSTLSGVLATSSGTLSVWLRQSSTVNSFSQFFGSVDYSSSNTGAGIDNSVTASQAGMAANASNGVDGEAANGSWTTGSWHNLLISWDMNFATGSKKLQMWQDDADLSPSGSNTGISSSVPYPSIGSWGVGAHPFTTTSNLSYNGDMFDLWFEPGTFMDFTTTSNRRKFINADLTHVDLGANGENPTGSAPAMFFHGSSWLTGSNLGTAGNFTVIGTLTATDGPP